MDFGLWLSLTLHGSSRFNDLFVKKGAFILLFVNFHKRLVQRLCLLISRHMSRCVLQQRRLIFAGN